MELRLTFDMVPEDKFDVDTYEPLELAGLSSTEAAAFATETRHLDAQATVTLERGEAGKGASGPAIQLVLHLSETVLNDGASVLAWGTALWAIVRRVQARRSRRLDVQDPHTIGLLAATAHEAHRERLSGATMGPVICLTGRGPGTGTDLRDIWLTPFFLTSGDVWVLFSSNDGAILGQVTVPARWTPERGEVSGTALAQLFKTLNANVADG